MTEETKVAATHVFTLQSTITWVYFAQPYIGISCLHNKRLIIESTSFNNVNANVCLATLQHPALKFF